VAQALGWARVQGLPVDDTHSYVSEFEHITLAMVLLARYATDGDTSSLHEVAHPLQRLMSAGDAGGRTGSVIEILVMQTITHHAGGDTPSAPAPPERALSLAEPEGYVRVFVGEGPPMASLLAAVARRRGRAANPGRTAAFLARRPSPAPSSHPDRQVTTSITTCGDAGSPHRLLPFEHTNKWPGDSSRRVTAKGAR